MISKFKFIHTADIHLGSIPHLNNPYDIDVCDNFNDVVYDSFKRIIEDAINFKVDFILISGDVFDINSLSIKANKFFIDMCNKLYKNDIKMFVICGNHDHMMDYNKLFELPHNVFIFPNDKPFTYEFMKDDSLKARIIGQSYKTRNDSRSMWKEFNAPKDGVFNIAMLHTSLDNDLHYVPCSVKDLKNKADIDYWALGHIHKRSLNLYSGEDDKRVIIYPGIPQGRNFKEDGVGGYYMVEVEDNVPNIQFIPTSSLVYKKIEINLEKNYVENMDDLENLIINKSLKISEQNTDAVKKYIVQWIIKGKTDIHDILMKQSIEDIDEFIKQLNYDLISKGINIFTDSISIRTKKYIPRIDELKSKNKIFMEIENVINEIDNNEGLKREVIKNMGKIWDDNYDHENPNYERLPLEDEMINEILAQAKSLMIEKLYDALIGNQWSE